MPRERRSKLLAWLTGPGFKFRQAAHFVSAKVVPWMRARRSLKQLTLELGPAVRSASGPVVVAAHYGFHPIVSRFLDHHRRLGIKEFVFLDLSVGGGLAEHLRDQAGCAVWRPHDLGLTEQVNYWLNGLRDRYGRDRWCLSLDTSDAFVFFRCEDRKLADFTEFLESESRDHASALVVDMYGTGPMGKAAPADEGGALDLPLPYFDFFGFVTVASGPRGATVHGGPQRRLLFKNRPTQSPALNRIPLVKWAWHYAYTAGTRHIVPLHLNNPHAPWHSSPTGCILRFALLQDPETLQNAAKWEAQVDTIRTVGPPSYPGLLRLREQALKCEGSRLYTHSGDLVEAGLLNPGQWF